MKRAHASRRTGPASSKRVKITKAGIPKLTTKSDGTLEIKQHAQAVATGSVSAAGDIQEFGLVPTGSANNDREGGVIRHLWFESRIVVTRPPTTNPYGAFRVVHGIWKNALAATVPGLAQLFKVPSTAFISPINHDYASRLTILGDEYFDIGANTAAPGSAPTTYGGLNKLITRRYRYTAKQEYYDESDDTVANFLHFICVVASGDAHSNLGYAGVMTTYYTDN